MHERLENRSPRKWHMNTKTSLTGKTTAVTTIPMLLMQANNSVDLPYQG